MRELFGDGDVSGGGSGGDDVRERFGGDVSGGGGVSDRGGDVSGCDDVSGCGGVSGYGGDVSGGGGGDGGDKRINLILWRRATISSDRFFLFVVVVEVGTFGS